MQSDVTVRDVMTPDFLGVSEGDDLVNTLELMLAEEVDSVVVLRGSTPVGVLNERDVLSLLVGGGDPHRATVADAMDDLVPAVPPEYGIDEAAAVMSAEGVRDLLVINGSDTVGLLSEHDLLSAATLERASARDDLLENGGESLDTVRREVRSTGTLEEQSICQECGALARNLQELDGQLLCADCLDV
jgi:CBS domain-containing protein